MDLVTTLTIDGSPAQRGRLWIVANGRQCDVPAALFIALAEMAILGVHTPPEYADSRYIWRLKRLVFADRFNLDLPVVADGWGHYRLDPMPTVRVNRKHLGVVPDVAISRLANVAGVPGVPAEKKPRSERPGLVCSLSLFDDPAYQAGS